MIDSGNPSAKGETRNCRQKKEAPKGFADIMLRDGPTPPPRKAAGMGNVNQAWAAFNAALSVGLGRMMALHLSASAL